jgi:hypothetical protein
VVCERTEALPDASLRVCVPQDEVEAEDQCKSQKDGPLDDDSSLALVLVRL